MANLLLLGLMDANGENITDLSGQEEITWSDQKEASIRYHQEAWRMVWSDEFDQDGAPDPAKWQQEKGMLRNNESQYYTVGRPENAKVENGCLVITALKEPWEKAEVTSASLNTKDRFHMKYGKIEIKAKVPPGVGTWPALWMLGSLGGQQLSWKSRVSVRFFSLF